MFSIERNEAKRLALVCGGALVCVFVSSAIAFQIGTTRRTPAGMDSNRYYVRVISGHGGAGTVVYIPAAPTGEPPTQIPCPVGTTPRGICVKID